MAPSRRTFAWGEDIFFSASKAFSARFSCTTPSTAFSTTTSRIMMQSVHSFSAKPEIMAATSRISTITSLNCSRNICSVLRRPAARSWFFPYFSWRSVTWAAFSPASGVTSNSRRAACALYSCQFMLSLLWKKISWLHRTRIPRNTVCRNCPTFNNTIFCPNATTCPCAYHHPPGPRNRKKCGFTIFCQLFIIRS